MKEKIDDIVTLVKNDRRVMFGLGAFAFFAVLWIFISGEPNRYNKSEVPRVTAQGGASNLAESDAVGDMAHAFAKDIDQLSKNMRETNQIVERLATDMADTKSEYQAVFETIVEKIELMQDEIENQQAQQVQAQIAGPDMSDMPSDLGATGELSSFGFETTDLPPPPPVNKIKRVSVITAGDSVPLKLLTGVNAPVDGTPYPVVFELAGPITGPDGAVLDVGESRVIAAAQGSEADGRVLFRLKTMAIRFNDGRRATVPIDGWIVGEDGIRGMKGRLIDKLGRVIASTAGAAFVAEIGNAAIGNSGEIRTGNDVDISAGDINFAAASALNQATDRLVQALLDRYEKLVPVVEILSGREVAAIFSKTAEIELMEEGGDEGIYNLTSVSLD